MDGELIYNMTCFWQIEFVSSQYKDEEKRNEAAKLAEWQSKFN